MGLGADLLETHSVEINIVGGVPSALSCLTQPGRRLTEGGRIVAGQTRFSETTAM